MALKRPLGLALTILAAASVTVLILELRQWTEIRQYNDAIVAGRFADAEAWLGDRGAFAKAYAEHQRGAYPEARAIYGDLGRSHDPGLRVAAQFNVGNTYLEQAMAMNLKAEADRALPLLELAKLSYREVLQSDSEHWDARYNLQRALLLSPDLPERRLMELEGFSRAVRTNVSAEPEGDLP